ncbi:unnamed protein product [Clonostachys byssicola]|uniref:Uncharacterized protein n=1 Tax=Clonostachys byssicola TaxID=160290 RepID=A0A9N9UWQ9_9HYPO|nr:unnamed protein product [Clonostachys byssicola]
MESLSNVPIIIPSHAGLVCSRTWVAELWKLWEGVNVLAPLDLEVRGVFTGIPHGNILVKVLSRPVLPVHHDLVSSAVMCQPIHDFGGARVPRKGKGDQPSPVCIVMPASGPVSSVDDVDGPAPLLGPAPPFRTASRGTTTTHVIN